MFHGCSVAYVLINATRAAHTKGSTTVNAARPNKKG